MQLLNTLGAITPTDSGITATIDDRHRLDVEVLDTNLARVWIRRDGQAALDRTWSVVSGGQDVPFEGRDRADISGFPLPQTSTTSTGDGTVVESGRIRLTIHSAPLRLEVAWNEDGEWTTLASDRTTGAYYLGSEAVDRDGMTSPRRTDVAHFQSFDDSERVLGLGDKSGTLDRAQGRFEMTCVDALGYDSMNSDPLYKHVPFTITKTAKGVYGVFYDNFSHAWFNLGKTKDNYHKRFRSWHADDGDIDYYVLFGDSVEDVTRAFVNLTGKPLFPPKWSLGYSQSTMTYPDAPDASDQLLHFIDLVKTHRIPCGSFQCGSGYTSIGPKRYLFHWNRDKFPDPAATVKAFHDAGMHYTANIKPCVLQDHPFYDDVAAKGYFVRDGRTGGPERSPFWDDEGSHVDFTNPAAVQWWKDNVTEQLLAYGIDVAWNDNNEFEIWDDNAICDGFGRPIPAGQVRPILSMLMTRASLEAQEEYWPDVRPFSVARSGGPGLQRYAQTWSGDNASSWETLKGNIRMGLSMTLSGMYNIGHDVGGFAGVKPDPELFLRWIQNGIVNPRFTLNSWHDDGSVNEPWMYPEIIDQVRGAIEFRARLSPYFYTLLHEASVDAEPILRPTFMLDEDDHKLWEDTDDFLLGGDLLVASVTEPGARTREVYLPATPGGWYDFTTGQRFEQTRTTVTLDAPLDRLPLLVRAGAAIPMGAVPAQHADAPDDERHLLLFPPTTGTTSTGEFYDDDGATNAYLDGQSLTVRWTQRASEDAIDIEVSAEGSFVPQWTELQVSLPSGDTRELRIHTVGELPFAVVAG